MVSFPSSVWPRVRQRSATLPTLFVGIILGSAIGAALFSSSPQASKSYAIRKDSGQLETTLHVANFLENGHLVPDGSKRIYVEIGANGENLLRDVLDKPEEKDTFLMTFEPLIDKWALILSHNVKAERVTRLSMQHDRAIVLPFAVSGEESFVEFNVAEQDGCSSLLKPKRASEGTKQGWPEENKEVLRRCTTTLEKRRVPTLSLDTIITKLCGGQNIDFLKIDAQGYDIKVLASAGNSMGKIMKVQMEVLGETVEQLYEGQPKCSEVLKQMEQWGFKPEESKPKCWNWAESDIVFIRS